MATTATRFFLRSAARSSHFLSKNKSFSSSGHDDSYEIAKWDNIACAGFFICTHLPVYILAKEYLHHDESPAYQYMNVRNNEFPWGLDGLFEQKY